MFRGSMPALVTPFKADGPNLAVDLDAFAAHVEWQIGEGSHGLVPVGTTGESPTLTHEEHYAVITTCVEVTARRVPVIAGCGSNDTRTAIAHLAHAQKVGADAALIVVPYYNKPSQAGLIAHFTALHDATTLPIIIYNIPGRSVADMSVETMAALAKLPRIIGVKDATGNIARVAQQRLACGADFLQLSGNDDMALGFNAQGGVGAISVTANVAPRLCAQMQEATLKGDYAAALAINDRLQPLHAALFSDTSPGPTKYALSRLGRMATHVRLPISAPSDAAMAAVDAALAHAGLV
ncbi:4-hydroxy-tetrahydrodipicolinate synthase [Sandarakinorhabdus cyanobacteriorum]|uniref:4-hydroxy-tetrahydrodipicolinate synthase n=1 Tax=Sandarakinorhabdus cyanobacteriorum TaxID=1981098 RepID=A0A255YDI6_9SPHN|nr:4-hydroxy-tetrahydrodipicolinate synthase [Sandarakinorhabdus cyanobacteriorum]OYQ27269.1 4-hydroxy-tetrahydrodipicolinate synthase [Sandarakinorhabdus cyanobacteriorum]